VVIGRRQGVGRKGGVSEPQQLGEDVEKEGKTADRRVREGRGQPGFCSSQVGD
jgi:hypothetical protein